MPRRLIIWKPVEKDAEGIIARRREGLWEGVSRDSWRRSQEIMTKSWTDALRNEQKIEF